MPFKQIRAWPSGGVHVGDAQYWCALEKKRRLGHANRGTDTFRTPPDQATVLLLWIGVQVGEDGPDSFRGRRDVYGGRDGTHPVDLLIGWQLR